MNARSTDDSTAASSAASSNPARPSIEWRWKPFDGLTNSEVYDMLSARTAVFVLEQQCLYDDVDGLDLDAWHLLAYGPDAAADVAADTNANAAPKLAGYLRVLLPDATDSAIETEGAAGYEPHTDIRIGRVLTTAAFRGIGLGNAMLERAIGHIRAQWPGTPISLHAQAHLQAFYGAFGFEPVSDIHEEDGIPHVWMRAA